MLVELPVLGRKKNHNNNYSSIGFTVVSASNPSNISPTQISAHSKLKHLLYHLKSSRALKRLEKNNIPPSVVQTFDRCSSPGSASVAVIQLQLLQPSVSVQLVALMI